MAINRNKKPKTGINDSFDRDDLLRLEDAFGEIIQQLAEARPFLDGECWNCMAEAAIEGTSIVRRGLGRCFNPDDGHAPYEAIDTSDNGAQGSEVAS